MQADNIESVFVDYFRCLDEHANLFVSGQTSKDSGYFKWGNDNICYGRTAAGFRTPNANGPLYDVWDDATISESTVTLPFDPLEVIENLRRERYTTRSRGSRRLKDVAVKSIYYAVRPYLSVKVRKHLQRRRLREWESIVFPEWPVDCTVERIQRRLMALAIRASGAESLPFIWFWPDDYRGCIIVTHDVETTFGRDTCGDLMDLDDKYGFKASFQVVPEARYPVPKSYLDAITTRGFEVNVHDLTHDGRLFDNHEEFVRRAKKINAYAKSFDASGFRSGILYRNPDWYDAFEFAYDMSIPNVGHLDPQRGGCCTVMPYFVGNIVELPLTCIQDYSLFHVLNEYSTQLWRKQIQRIMENNGLITILAHPDYVVESRAKAAYEELLSHLAVVRQSNNLWAPIPKDLAAWWRQRSKMKLVSKGSTWEIEGEGKERARIAYARLDGDSVTYSVS